MNRKTGSLRICVLLLLAVVVMPVHSHNHEVGNPSVMLFFGLVPLPTTESGVLDQPLADQPRNTPACR
jgi:hypothetical protein